MLKLGIDDAGRGPVMGPMILAGCLIDEKVEKELRNLGVKDSKDLTQKRREFLEQKIKEIADTFEVVLATPNEIDSNLESGTNLNEVEANMAAKIINKINQKNEKIKVIVDCPSVSILKWTDMLKTKIKNLSNLEIVCEHKADRNHISVSAASILAKCVREREVGKLKEEYGNEIGTGYPSDPSTCKFLEKNAIKFKDKGIFRKSWSSWKRARDNLKQDKLF